MATTVQVFFPLCVCACVCLCVCVYVCVCVCVELELLGVLLGDWQPGTLEPWNPE